GPTPLRAVLDGRRRRRLRAPRRPVDRDRRQAVGGDRRLGAVQPRRAPAEGLVVLGIALGLASSVAWGISDFLGGLTTRRISALSVLLVSQPLGLVLALVVALAAGGDSLSGREVAIAAGSGAAAVLALGAFYRAMALGSISVV